MADDFYYNRAGKKVALTPDPTRYVVRFRRGRTVLDAALTPDSRDFVQVRSTHQRYVAQYNLQLYEVSAGAGTSKDRAAVRTLNDETNVEFASPVFRRSRNPNDVAFVLNRFIIEFVEGVGEMTAESFLTPLNAQYNVRILQKLGYTKPRVGYLLETSAGDGPVGPVQLARTYYEKGNSGDSKLVLYAIPDLVQPREFKSTVRATSRDDDQISWTYKTEQWHLQQAKVIDAWAITQGDASISVAIADDGVDVDHPEFVGRITAQFDFAAGSADCRPKSAMDNHGTACAGVAVAAGTNARGAAPHCRIIGARTPDLLGVQDEADMFQWLADRGADVISCSWGPPDGTGEVYPLADNVESALEYCQKFGRNGKGTPIVWAAGNGNESVSNDGYAACRHVIAVAASTDHDTHSYYSDYGKEVWVCAPSSGKSADGNKRVFTTDRSTTQGYNAGGSTNLGDVNGMYTNDFGGTSSAAPLVAGIIALMLSANAELKAADVRQILKDTADKIGTGYDSNGHSDQFGYGRVNAQRAVAEAQRRSSNGGTGSGNNNTGGNPGNTTGNPIGSPSVTGPAQVSRSGPTFQVGLPAGRFYAFEAAVNPTLFSAGARGPNPSQSEFYATWQSSSVFLDQQVYRLPADVWARLSAAPRVYYRILTSAQKDRWQDSRATEISSVQVID